MEREDGKSPPGKQGAQWLGVCLHVPRFIPKHHEDGKEMGNPHSLQGWGRSELGEGEYSPKFRLPVFSIHFPGLPGKDQ